MPSTLNIDRLSELPESIILHILSFLEVDESAITAVLSRRWQHLWTQSPELCFRQGNMLVPDFVARVNRTLVARRPDHYVENLSVGFGYNKHFAPDVNAWAQFAVNIKVKRVAFLLKTSSDFHVLPQLICSNSSLNYLDIKGCTIAPQRTIDWPSLTELQIKGVEVQQQLIAKLLSGCPVLSFLSLNKCWGFNSLEIKSKCLKEIWILDHYRDDINNEPLLEISAPYIKSLSVYLGYPERRKLRLTNIPSNVIADISFAGWDFDLTSVEVMNNAKELLGNINHVKEVVMRPIFVEVLSRMAFKYCYQIPQSTSRTSLKVYTERDELGDIHGILGLLKSSPNLQELVIKGKFFSEEPYDFTFANGDLASDLTQLKTVIIKNFVAPNLAGEPMLTLARILLKRTPVLEKIVIYVKEIAKSSEALDPITIHETVLGYPRLSHKASILLR